MRGVTVDLLRGFADALNLPLELQVYSNSGQVTDAVAGGTCDVAFMPHDAARAEKVDFGPPYFIIESTYMVPAGSSIDSIEAVNRPGVRIVAIANTTTGRSARRTAPQADFEEVTGVELMIEKARNGQGDAFALTHDSLAGLLPKVPGARILPGNFQQTGIGIAVPKGLPSRAQARHRFDRGREKIGPRAARTRCRRLQGRGRRAAGGLDRPHLKRRGGNAAEKCCPSLCTSRRSSGHWALATVTMTLPMVPRSTASCAATISASS